MTRLADVLFEYLSGTSVTDLTDGEFRIYPVRRPEGSFIPAVSWRLIDANRIYTYEPFEETSAWVTARVEFSCWALTYDEASALGDAVMLALSGYDNDFIGSSDAINELDRYEDDHRLFRRLIDFRITYEDDLVTAS